LDNNLLEGLGANMGAPDQSKQLVEFLGGKAHQDLGQLEHIPCDGEAPKGVEVVQLVEQAPGRDWPCGEGGGSCGGGRFLQSNMICKYKNDMPKMF
jgi:hypothetical protein